MLAGVLTVLKIIGIILLVILAVVLVLLLLILFVPIRYRADAVIPDTNLSEGFDVGKVTASASVSWFLSAIWCGLEFPRNRRFTIKVFGIQIYPRKHKDGKENGSKDETRSPGTENGKDKTKPSDDGSGGGAIGQTGEGTGDGVIGQTGEGSGDGEINQAREDAGNGLITPDNAENAEGETNRTDEGAGEGEKNRTDQGEGEGGNAAGDVEGEVKPADTADGEGNNAAENGTDEVTQEPSDETQHSGDSGLESGENALQTSEDKTDSGESDAFTDEEDDKSFIDVILDIVDAIVDFIRVPMDVFEKIRYTISRACDKMDIIRATLENDIFKRAFALVKSKLIVILKMSLPDKCEIKLLAGTGDPVSTATITGVYGMLYPFVYRQISFQPDFDRMAVMADIHIKGHITLFTIIYSAAICYFNKDVKRTVRRFKRIIS